MPKDRVSRRGDLRDYRPDAAWRRRLRRRLLAWYGRHARDLPWRASRNPYRVWVSEIMLQQTQVATVRGYFNRFVERFPTLESLADADLQDVLRLWEGLGYYRRGRQLHQAARRVVAEHAARLPHSVEELVQLPGIGRYTAGAIASIAFDEPAPILEANTRRLFARLLALHMDPSGREGSSILWGFARAILPRRDVGTFNQALMELGSEVCIRGEPRCDECPVAVLCRARALNAQRRIPPPPRRQRIEAVREAAVAIRRRGRVLLMQWGNDGRWAGMWDFPRFPIHSTIEADIPSLTASHLWETIGVRVDSIEPLAIVRHAVTRFRITLHAFEATYVSGVAATGDGRALRWVKPTEFDNYPLSSPGRRLARSVSR